MGKKNKSLKIDYIDSNIYPINCNKCPSQLYADKDISIKFGIGNILSDTCFIINSDNYNGDNLKLLIDLYKKAFDKDLLENCYVTRSIKCFNIYNIAIKPISERVCSNHLFYEIYNYNFKRIIFTYNNDYINDMIAYYNQNGIKAVSMMNINRLYFDNTNYDDFINSIRKAISL